MRKDSEIVIVLKWLGMGFGVCGTIASAMNLFPQAPILLIINCALWTAVGRAWREPTVWVTNAIACGVTTVVLLLKLMR